VTLVNLTSLTQLLRGYGKYALETSALVLSIVNGLMLLRFYLRDRARLAAHPVHPDVYQWWFSLSPCEVEGKLTRRFGFILYVAVQNSGLRKTQLTSWRLWVRSGLGKSHELKPMSMPEPSAELGDHRKFYPVLGQRGTNFEGDTLVDSGCSTSGMAYYLYECFGAAEWDPKITEERITCTFQVSDAFKNKARCEVRFMHKSLEEMKAFAPGIDRIDEK
jgi:hypothetical protein